MLAAGGSILFPWRRGLASGLLAGGLLLLAGAALARGVALGSSSPGGRLVTLPGPRPSRWLDRLIDEQDAALFGVQAARWVGFVLPEESQGLAPALAGQYREMNQIYPRLPSPFLATYLGLQRPGAFDLVVFEPVGEAAAPPQAAVVFIHGFTGNFSLQCWLVARAALEAGLPTVCPSTGWEGDWWRPEGASILAAVLDDLQARGIQRYYLAGLSNGGIGACRLASGLLKRPGPQLAGLILISGADPEALPDGLRVLVIHGNRDRHVSPSYGQQAAVKAGSLGAYALYPGDHFVLAKRAAEIQPVLRDWLLNAEDTLPPAAQILH